MANFKLTDIIYAKIWGQAVVDTCLTFDGFYETMVFKINPVTGIRQMYPEVDSMRYANEDQAREGHQKMIEKWRS